MQYFLQKLSTVWTVIVLIGLGTSVLIVTAGLVRRVFTRSISSDPAAGPWRSVRDYFVEIQRGIVTLNIKSVLSLMFLKPTESVVLLMILLPIGFVSIAIVAAILEIVRSSTT